MSGHVDDLEPLTAEDIRSLGFEPTADGWRQADGVVVEDKPDGIELVRASTITPRPVEWAWQERIPLGTTTVLAGIPGLGKSTITLDLAARWSRGQQQGDLKGQPVNVLLATAEDSPEQTIVPRLLAAGTDLDRAHFVRVRRGGYPGGITLPDDIDPLAGKIREVGARVLIVDPFAAHLSERVNSWRDHDVRRAMAPVHHIADEMGLAVLLVMHLKKGDEREVLHKIGGSGGVPAAARSVLLVGADPTDPEGSSRVLAFAKSNLGPEAPSIRYRIEAREADGIPTSGIAWLEEDPDVRAADLVGGRDAGAQATEAAWEFLAEELAAGPKPAEELRARWKRRGGSYSTLKRAKRNHRVESFRVTYGGPWLWRLSDQEP
jgi:hypothetical protein